MRDQLEKLVQELLDKGVLDDDARREFEKMFIARALQRSKGNVGDAAELLGMHRNTIARKITEYRIKTSPIDSGSVTWDLGLGSELAGSRRASIPTSSPISIPNPSHQVRGISTRRL